MHRYFCWKTVHSVLWFGSSGWWMQQRDLSAILVGWHLYPVFDFIGCACLSESATRYKLCLLVFMAMHQIISVSSADRNLKTLLVLVSARQHTAISRFHVRRPTLVIVYLQSPGQRHKTDYTSNNPVIWLCRISRTESSLFFWWAVFFFSIHLERGRPWIGLHITAPKKLTLYYALGIIWKFAMLTLFTAN